MIKRRMYVNSVFIVIGSFCVVAGVHVMMSDALIFAYEWSWVLQVFMVIGLLAVVLLADILILDNDNPYYEELYGRRMSHAGGHLT